MISIPGLLVTAGVVEDIAAGWRAIGHGNVRFERWTIGIPEGSLPRWLLRGVTISVGDRSITISDDGSKVLRPKDLQLA